MTRATADVTRQAGNVRTVQVGTAAQARRPAWRTINISPVERAGRIVIGLAAIIAGAVLLASAGPVAATVLKALLIAAGLDLAITGALGHCPLYAKLGHLPRSIRGSR